MKENELHGILSFLKSAEQLKNTLRSARTSNGRHESTAEHTWRLCLMVLLFEGDQPEIDILRLLKICLIHDLGETLRGDIAAVDQSPDQNKGIEERRDVETLIEPLPRSMRDEILSLWDEYEKGASREALLAKAFDKLETLLQHTQGENPDDFNYGFNLSYGKEYTGFNDVTRRLRVIIDEETRRLALANGTI